MFFISESNKNVFSHEIKNILIAENLSKMNVNWKRRKLKNENKLPPSGSRIFSDCTWERGRERGECRDDAG